MGQAELAYQQAMETARQGRTVMLFTVITIIFVSHGYDKLRNAHAKTPSCLFHSLLPFLQ